MYRGGSRLVARQLIALLVQHHHVVAREREGAAAGDRADRLVLLNKVTVSIKIGLKFA